MNFTSDSPNHIPMAPYGGPAAGSVMGGSAVGAASRYDWPAAGGSVPPAVQMAGGPYHPAPQVMNVPHSVKTWQAYCVQLSKQAMEAAAIARTATAAAEAAAQALAKLIANPPTDPHYIAPLPDLLKAEGHQIPRLPPKTAIRSLNNTLQMTGQPMIAADGTKISTLKNRRRNQKKRQRDREEREQGKKTKLESNATKADRNGGNSNENGNTIEQNSQSAGDPAMEAEEIDEPTKNESDKS